MKKPLSKNGPTKRLPKRKKAMAHRPPKKKRVLTMPISTHSATNGKNNEANVPTHAIMALHGHDEAEDSY